MSQSVLWKVSSLSADLASVRYRALLPALGLQAAGIASTFTVTARVDLLEQSIRAVVIVKSFAADDLVLASEAKTRGIPVVYDLCDNIFVPGYRGKGDSSPAEMFEQIARYCVAVTVPTAALRDVVAAQLPPGTPVVEIPDCAESIRERAAATEMFERSNAPVDVVALAHTGLVVRVEQRLRRFVREVRAWLRGQPRAATAQRPHSDSGTWRQSRAPLLLWFGNRGNSYTTSGLNDLLLFCEALNRAGRELGAELVVLSNGRSEFEAVAAKLDLRVHYEDWTLQRMEEALTQAAVVLVPNSMDEFSACKSANRSLLALKRGVPVVASPTRALAPLKDFVWLSDPFDGLKLFLTDHGAAQKWVASAAVALEKQYSVRAVGRLWRSVVDSFAVVVGQGHHLRKSELFFTIGLQQDLDVVAPILAEANARGVGCFVYVALSVIQSGGRVARYLAEHKTLYAVLPDKFDSRVAEAVVRRHRAGFFPAETSLNPHRFSHRLCKFALRARCQTYTIQHGIDNVGLTYSDDVHRISEVKILSRKIFLWGPTATLHPEAPDDVRQRCMAVGCPKPARTVRAPITFLEAIQRPIVGVFENLHWHRYSDDYRAQFLATIADSARQLPGVVFLVKPHNAGMWLTARYKGDPITGENIVVADPAQPEWEPYTAPQLLGYMRAVVTTPSTVALDAARAGIPTSMMRFGVDLSRYEPLPMIEGSVDLIRFVDRVVGEEGGAGFSDLNQRFVDRHVLPGDATARIVRIIQDQLEGKAVEASETCSVI